MYLKRIIINNFRKFGLENNEVEFVDAQNYLERKEAKDVNIASTTTLIVGKNNAGKTTIIKAMNVSVTRAVKNLKILYIDDVSGFSDVVGSIFGKVQVYSRDN